MASSSSVQELLLAANAKAPRSSIAPLLDLLETGIAGYQTGQGIRNQHTETAIQILKADEMRRAAEEYAVEKAKLDEKERLRQESQKDNVIANGLKNIGSIGKSAFPEERITTTFENGRVKKTITQVEPKQSDIAFDSNQLDAILSGDSKRMAAAFPYGIPPRAVELSQASIRTSNLQAERNEREDERSKTRFRNYFLDLEQRDPIIKEMRKQEIGLNQVNSLVDIVKNGNTVAASALGTKMARGMGEVGVLTESDISRYVQSGRLDRKAADKLSLMMQGRPTESSLAEIKQITEVLGETFREKIQPRYDQFIETYSNIENMKPEQFAGELALTYYGKKKKAATEPADTNETIEQKKAKLREKLKLGQ